MSALDPVTAKPTSITEIVLNRIQTAIVEKVLAPGERLSEAKLADTLNVSKTPVREALLLLRAVGLVEQGERGMQVVMPAPRTIQHAYELRVSLERGAVSLAAQRASEEDIQRAIRHAEASLACASAGDDDDGFRREDQAFHMTIVRGTRNPMLETGISNSFVLTRALRERDVPHCGDRIMCAYEHVAIAEAIQQRDGEHAALIVQQHILRVMQLVLGAMAHAEDSGSHSSASFPPSRRIRSVS